MAFVDLLTEEEMTSDCADRDEESDSSTVSNFLHEKVKKEISDSIKEEKDTESLEFSGDVDKDVDYDRVKKVKKTDNRVHGCRLCNYKSSSVANFKKHLLVHSGEKPYKCTYCQKVFRQKNHLQDHERSHTGKRPFKCELCGAGFVHKSSLNVHRKKHTVKFNSSSPLPLCETVLKEEPDDNCNEEANDGCNEETNDDCNEETNDDCNEETNDGCYEETNDDSYEETTDACSEDDDEDELKSLVDMIDDDKRATTTSKKKTYDCIECNLKSQSFANFKKHMMTHSGEKPYSCDECHKSFRQKHHLDDHHRIHTGERPYECDECGSTFVQKSSLNLHKKKHTGVRPYTCSLCDHSAYEKMHLIMHMRTHTGEKPYQCEKCGVSFSSSSRLKFHTMIHTGERRYVCDVCGVRFREKVTLQKHKGSHINKGPFPCEECGQEFSRLASLSLHRKVHTNRDAYINKLIHDTTNEILKTSLLKARSSLPAVVTNQQNARGSDNSSLSENRILESEDNADQTQTEDNTEQICNKVDETSATTPTNETHPSDVIKSVVLDNISVQNTTDSGRQRIKHSPTKRMVPKRSKTANKNPNVIRDDKEDKHLLINKHTGINQTSESDHSTKSILKDVLTTSRLQKNLKQNLVGTLPKIASNVAQPDCLREALERGTVKESQDIDGNEFVIVLPPSLKHTEISFMADANTGTLVPMLMHTDAQTLNLIRGESDTDTALSKTIAREPCGSLKSGGVEKVGMFLQDDIAHDTVVKSETIDNFHPDDSTCDTIEVVEGEILEDDMDNCPAEVGELHIVDDTSKAAQIYPGVIEQDATDVQDYLDKEGIYAEPVYSLSNAQHESELVVSYVIEQGCADPSYQLYDIKDIGSITDRTPPETAKPRKRRRAKGSESSADDAKKKMKLKAESSGTVEMEMQNSSIRTEGKEFNVKTAKIKERKVRILKKDSSQAPHMRTHKERKVRVPKERKIKTPKDYDCHQCGKDCKTSSNYIAHMRTHTGERPYFCDICGVAFKQISHLRAHVRIHTGEKPYACNVCNVAYTQSSRLNAHMKAKHGDGANERQKKVKPVKESKVRNFYCKVCDKTFINECFKREHMKSHKTATPSYECKICGANYKTKPSLKKHTRKHCDHKYICEICGTAFVELSSLQNHKIDEHKASVTDADVLEMCINVRIGEEKDFVVINPAIKSAVKDEGGNDVQMKEKREQVLITYTDDRVRTNGGSCNIQAEDNQRKADVQAEGSSRNTSANKYNSVETETESQAPDSTVTIKDEMTDTTTEGTKTIIEKFTDITTKEVTKTIIEEVTTTEITGNTGGKVWECKECDEVFDQSSALKSHMKTHKGKRTYHCEVCFKTFLQSSNLTTHMRMHTGERPYQCNKCHRAFKQINHLKDHMFRHSSKKPFSCGECGVQFTQRTAIKTHIKRYHEQGAEIVKNSFENLENDRDSEDSDSRSAPSRKQIRNERSPKRTKNKNIDKKTDTKKSACQVCKKEYSAVYLKIHERCHTGERPYKCSFCDESFKQVSHLSIHELRHTGERHFSCEKCDKSFPQSHTYKKHLKKCTRSIGKMKTAGRFEQLLRSDEDSENSDLKSTTSRKQIRKNGWPRKYKNKNSDRKTITMEACKVCDKLFTPANLKIHERSHTGQQLHKCNFCVETFKKKSLLQYHEFQHTGEKPFTCDKCKVSFIRSQHCKRHMEKCTGTKNEEKSNTLEDQNVCCECGISFGNYNSLMKHQETCRTDKDSDLTTDSEDFPIPYDDESDENLDSFERESEPEKHTSGQERSKRHTSVKCKSSKKENENLKLQGSRKTTMSVKGKSSPKCAVKKFTCKCCSLTFQNVAKYKKHLHQKEGFSGEICEDCGETFRRASALKFHQKMKHGRTYDG